MEAFEEQVQQQIERLQSKPLRDIEKAVSEKRLNWWVSHWELKIDRPVSPRYAFECLFYDYMGIAREDLPILSESDNEITWASQNPCPTLEACNRLGLDTRNVCRQAYEKSTQTFISQLDPQLRFTRSYTEIRPYARICRESILRVDFDTLMQEAIVEAQHSRDEGNKGYGAVLWHGGRVLARTHDTAGTQKDPSQDAEMNAIRHAVGLLGSTNLCGAVLVSTCEPSPANVFAAAWANVSAIVYGASIKETTLLRKARIVDSTLEIVKRSPAQVEIIPGVLRKDCLKLYR